MQIDRDFAMRAVAEGDSFTNLSADAAVKSGPGVLVGFICNSSSSGTLTLYDNTAASGTKIINGLSCTAGQFYPAPCRFNNGLYADVGGTVDLTFFYA